MSDLSLERAIMDALADNPHVHADEIVAQVVDGDVALRGTVGSTIQREEAARTTRGVPGVRRVDDQLRVRLMDSDRRADADTEAAVLGALIADDHLHAADVDVRSRDSAVTLRGLVELPSQRDRAERIALGVPGVTHVDNRIGFSLTVTADEVAERVTGAIGVDAIVGADRVDVRVRDNDVTLTGTVTSPEHLVAAVAAAKSVPGVARVHDELSLGSQPS